MTQKIELMLLDPDRPRDEPRKITEFRASVVPGAGEVVSWNSRVFRVLGRAFALEEREAGPISTDRCLHMDVALVVQQVGGPPMLVATPAPLKI